MMRFERDCNTFINTYIHALVENWCSNWIYICPSTKSWYFNVFLIQQLSFFESILLGIRNIVLILSCHIAIGWILEWALTAQCLLSRAAFIEPAPTSPVQFRTLSIHDILGLPCPRTPSMRPVIRLVSMLSCGCLMSWYWWSIIWPENMVCSVTQ